MCREAGRESLMPLAESNRIEFPRDQLALIAGPCSAESKAQMLEAARSLAAANIWALRAGVWKPRSRPGSFEGGGKEGLRWLVEAAREIGRPAATEVATPAHVEAALGAGVRVVWIGADRKSVV